MKKCGLVIRVSTDRQAANEEGSLKNQQQRLRAHVEYKNDTSGEQWGETDRYVLSGISGKDSLRSPELQRLRDDIRAGRINTVLCTALDRVSRSTADFLNFIEFLNENDVEFVCLKQQCDTTTPHGKLLMTFMVGLAQFEREQTSERTRDAILARAERGLWNGGHLLGYDLDPEKKGNIIPDDEERVIVNFAFDEYLRCGSILKTRDALNKQGFRTKEYTSRDGTFHPAARFSHSTVQRMLMNCAYIGKKEVNKKNKGKDQDKLPESQRYRIVDAVWEPIVDEEKFYRVQELLKKNDESRHNSAKPIRHTYILNHGLLWCGDCGTQMGGTCGNGARGGKYYYYLCKNKECRFKVPAAEVEGAILERIRVLSTQAGLLEGIVGRTSAKLQQELPQLREQRRVLKKSLGDISDVARGLLRDRQSLATDNSEVFYNEELEELGKRRKEVEDSIQALEEAIGEIERESVDHEQVMQALGQFSEVFGQLPPYQQKELVRLVVHRVELAPDCMKMALYGRVPALGPVCAQEGVARSQTSNWLPVCASIRTRANHQEAASCFRVLYAVRRTERGAAEYRRRPATL